MRKNYIAIEFEGALSGENTVCRRLNGVQKENERLNCERDFDLDELNRALMELKSNKCPGEDGIIAETYKMLPQEMIEEILIELNRIWENGELPNEFKRGIILPIYKKGNRRDPKNYRGISLLNTIGKVYTKLVQYRIEEKLEADSSRIEMQAGYRRGYSTIDHIYTLKEIIEIQKLKGKKVYTGFIDMSSAFDTVDREILVDKVNRLIKANRITKAIENLYTNTTARVWDGNKFSREFRTTKGVRQGCNLSGLLFNIYLHELPERLIGGIVINGTKINILMYADDLAIVAESRDQLQMMINKTKEYCDRVKLRMNIEKTKWMIFGGDVRKEKIYINRKQIEKVTSYKFLGVVFQKDGKWTKHIEERKKKCRQAMGALWKIFKDKGINTHVKIKIYNSMIESIMLYGAEVYGNGDITEIGKIERLFYKRIFELPNGTPNYFIVSELNIERELEEKAEDRFRKYQLKIESMSTERLPSVVNKERKRIDKSDTRAERRVSEELRRNRKLKESRRAADTLEGHTGSRLLYPTLSHQVGKNLLNEKPAVAGLIIRARLEMMTGKIGTKEWDNPCKFCGRHMASETVHLMGECSELVDCRSIILGKEKLNLMEIRCALDRIENWKGVAEFVEYCRRWKAGQND